ncbi:hypothetical protein Hanom_Chr04g00369101 [Helianthus anomalus]
MWYKCYKVFSMPNISRQDLRFINLNSAYLADLIILSNLEQRHQVVISLFSYNLFMIYS